MLTAGKDFFMLSPKIISLSLIVDCALVYVWLASRPLKIK